VFAENIATSDPVDPRESLPRLLCFSRSDRHRGGSTEGAPVAAAPARASQCDRDSMGILAGRGESTRRQYAMYWNVLERAVARGSNVFDSAIRH